METSLTARLLQVLLPNGGYVVASIEAYFDESGSHAGSPFLCVAGYVFETDQCALLDKEWKAMLDQAGLPYLRMSECAPDPGHGPFAALSKPQRIAVATTAIGLIKTHMAYGFALSLDMAHVGMIQRQGHHESPYSFLCWNALQGVRHWIRLNHYRGDVAYFFESGHASQSEANGIMNRMFSDPNLCDAYRYASHTFADKKKVRPLQCADMLAWHWFTHQKRIVSGRDGVRADFGSLQEKPHWVTHYDQHSLRATP